MLASKREQAENFVALNKIFIGHAQSSTSIKSFGIRAYEPHRTVFTKNIPKDKEKINLSLTYHSQKGKKKNGGVHFTSPYESEKGKA